METGRSANFTSAQSRLATLNKLREDVDQLYKKLATMPEDSPQSP